MKEMYSKSKDVEFLAYELIKILKEKIEINYLTLGQEVLTAKICLDETKITRFDGIDFNVKYSQGEFLRINVGEINLLAPYKEKLEALKEISKAISKIETKEGSLIGEPLAFYYIQYDGCLVPYCDWAFTNKEEYTQELINNTMYDDASIENLIIFDNTIEIEPTLQKTKENK